MPLYMDRHDLEGATPEEVAAAHVQDVQIQDQYGVRYVTYWHDIEAGSAFCLAEGPGQDAVEAVHRDAHGLIANKVIEVDAAMVRHFLGRIEEPVVGEPWVETAFRAVLFTDIENSTSLTQLHGDAKAMAIVRAHDEMVRSLLDRHDGNEVKHTGDGIMASFTSVARALAFAVAMQRRVDEHSRAAEVPFRIRIGVSAGEPVTENDDLFGTVVQLAARLCASADAGEICTSTAVRELALGKSFQLDSRGALELKGFDEPVQVFGVHWSE
ncbi:MAG TPA: nickel-binding protein [Acidimicrobiia bacterium]|nr:nickel-binding protein [Acidimicrobiia bacterium]